jgi:hypothetical protein
VLNELVIGLLATGLALAVVGAAGFCVAVAGARTRHTVAVAVGMATLGVAGWLTFWAYFISPRAGRLVAAALITGAVVIVAVACRRSAAARHALRAMVPAVAMMLGTTALTVALVGLWSVTLEPFEFARVRFSRWYLPVDNEIPQLLVDRLVAGGDPRTFMQGWQSSDRPPLQAGLMLMVHDLAGATGLDRSMAGFVGGMACQLAWIPGVAVLVRSIGASRRGTLAAMLFTGLTGTVLVNTIYTWPKLLSAAFVLAALAVVFQSVRPGSRSVAPALGLVGLLLALGMLAHGAAMFAMPIVALVLLYRWRALTLRGVGLLVAAAGVGYFPWILYQRFVDPPGSRLLYWHLAEIGYPDPAKGGVLKQVTDAYVAAGWETTLANKWANLVKPFSIAPWDGLSITGVDDPARRVAEFYTFSGAIGFGWIAAVGTLAAVVLAFLRRQERDQFAVHVVLLLGAGLVSIAMWAVVMFGPGTTFVHHGSHVFILIALAAPLAWLVDRSPWVGAAIIAVSGTVCLSTYLYQTQANHIPGHISPVSRRALALAVVGALFLALAFLVTARRRPTSQLLLPPEPVDIHVGPTERRSRPGMNPARRPIPTQLTAHKAYAGDVTAARHPRTVATVGDPVS